MKYIKVTWEDLFWIMLIVWIFSSCNSEKKCQRELTAIQIHCPELLKMKDTTIYKMHDTVIYYHDVITTPEVTHTDTFSLPCPDHKAITQKFKGGSATVTINKGNIIVTCKEDSLRLVINHKDSILLKQSELIKTGIAIKYLPALPTFWDSLYKGWFWVSIILLAVGLVAAILKSKI